MGIGVTLMSNAIAHTLAYYQTNQIKIGAQLYLKKFYEGFGFVQTSEIYVEDGIEHMEMLLTID